MNGLTRRTGITLLSVLFGLSGAPATALFAADGVGISELGNRVKVDTGAIVMELVLAPEGAVVLESFKRAEGEHDWAMKGAAAGINLSSDLITLTGCSAGEGFQHRGHSARLTPGSARELKIDLEHEASKLQATLLLTAYPNSPVVDLSLRLRNSGQAPLRNLSRFDALSVALPARTQPYRAYWVTRNSYGLHEAEVGDELTVDGGNWNGPNAAGWLALQDQAAEEFLVAGIEWERHWAFDLRREDNGRAHRLSVGLRRACTQDLPAGGSMESPHVFLGLAKGDLDDAANTTHEYLKAHVLPPLPTGFPFVCYDIWSTEQQNVEGRLLDEARFAAEKLGVEVFYHDAAWYRDSDVTNKERWGIGLGNYTEDRRKFPNGLRHLSEVVHGLGMKFGLWVCPEMVDVTVMEREGIPGQWMTMAHDQYNVQEIGGWNPMKMLCIGNPAVEARLQKQLLRIAEEFKLDWLKWDASGLPGLDVVCDRADHGHQAGDGSQAAVLGKYRILEAIHEQHPGLILEQCSYGTRLDYGMGRCGARANWLSDSTAPSSHVRDNVMAAAYVLPSACNITWVMRDEEVRQPQSPAFLDTIIRSRMMGGFGFGTLHGSLGECVTLYPPPVISAAIRNVKDYKTYRHLLSENVYHLTPWGKTNAWQAMQFAAGDQQQAVAFFFRNGASETGRRFKLRGLDARSEYEIVHLNTGGIEPVRGESLMQLGVEVTLARSPEESEILRLKAIKR